MAWRYGIAPVEEFELDGLRMRADHYPGRAFKSSRGDGTPFDVGGRKRATTDEHADDFDAKESGILIAGDDEPFRLPPPPPETGGRRKPGST